MFPGDASKAFPPALQGSVDMGLPKFSYLATQGVHGFLTREPTRIWNTGLEH